MSKEQVAKSKARYNNLNFASPTKLALAPCSLLTEYKEEYYV